MAIIYTGDFYRPEETPKRLGSCPAPDDQDLPRWLPLFFLVVGLLLGAFVVGLVAWASGVFFLVQP